MDRSFLSRPEVVQASREFVCIRLATYENGIEAEVLRRLFVGGSGQVENTTFAILSPDGSTPLVRSGRGPDWAFADASQMARGLRQIARYYRHSNTLQADLPTVNNLRLALNVAACDNLPVVGLISDNSQQLLNWRRQLALVAWQPQILGRAVYVCESSREARRQLSRPGTRGNSSDLVPGLWVLQPDVFGQGAQVLSRLNPESEDLARLLDRALKNYQPIAKDAHTHVREGRRRGVYWQTQIPVTDPHH